MQFELGSGTCIGKRCTDSAASCSNIANAPLVSLLIEIADFFKSMAHNKTAAAAQARRNAVKIQALRTRLNDAERAFSVSGELNRYAT
jgi:hypothetical protein